MISSFDAEGDLPPGIHQATWAEFKNCFCRFARSSRRLRLCQKIEQLVVAARASSIVERLIFGGSFVTATEEPNDFDVVVIFHAAVDVTVLRPYQLDLVDGARARRRFKGDVFPARSGTPQVEHSRDGAAKLLAFFQHTRLGKAIGVVEVLLE